MLKKGFKIKCTRVCLWSKKKVKFVLFGAWTKKDISTLIFLLDTTHSLSFISFGLVSIGLRANNSVSLRKNARKHWYCSSFCSEDDYLSFRLSDMWLRQLFLSMHCWTLVNSPNTMNDMLLSKKEGSQNCTKDNANATCCKKQLMHRRRSFTLKETARAGQCLFEKKEVFKDHMSKRQLWVKFWILFFSSILTWNGHAIHLLWFVSFSLVEIGLHLCNSKQLQAYRFSRN